MKTNTNCNMAKSYSIEDLKAFVEKNGHMPRPQNRKDENEKLLGLWVFRTLRSADSKKADEIRTLAKGVPGPCPKPKEDRREDFRKFCETHKRLPSSGEEKSLYEFFRRHRDDADFQALAEKYKKEGK